MGFRFGRCELCNELIFEKSQLVAFRRTINATPPPGVTISFIGSLDDVGSSGIGCVCRPCVAVLGSNALSQNREDG